MLERMPVLERCPSLGLHGESHTPGFVPKRIVKLGPTRWPKYLASGTVRQGHILEVRFPLREDGGPISDAAALRLLDSERPFCMAFGQWLFVHAE
jgi:hypothetical protein